MKAEVEETIAQTAWMIDRDYFLSPRTWRTHSDTLHSLVLPPRPTGTVPDTRRRRMEADFERLERTNDWLSMRISKPADRPAADREKDRQNMVDHAPTPTSVSKVLDNIGRPDGVKGTARVLFGNDPFGKERRTGTRARIKDVLEWMTQRAAVDPRSIITGVAIVRTVVLDDFPVDGPLALDQAKERSRRYHLVSEVVLDWIREMSKDTSRHSGAQIDSVVQVLGQLIRAGLFEYQDYLGHMVSIGGQSESIDRTFDREILARLPWHEENASAEFQRRMLLYGSNPELQQQEDEKVEGYESGLREYLADWLLNDGEHVVGDSLLPVATLASTRWRAWTRVRIEVVKRIRALEDDGELGGSCLPRVFRASLSVLDYELILELVDRITNIPASNDRVQLACIQALEGNTVVWDALDVADKAKSLAQTLQSQRSDTIARRYLPSQAEQDLNQLFDANIPAEPSDSITSTTQLFRDVVEIHRQPSLEAVDRLAEGLVREFPRDGQVGEQVWNLALAGLADLDITLLQPEGDNKAVEATFRLLQSLGEHYPGVMDLAFRKWARSILRKPTVATVNEQSCSLLLELVAQRVIPIRSVLEALLLPLWRSMAAFVSSANQAVPEQSRFVSVLSRAIFQTRTSDTVMSLSTRLGLGTELELAFKEPSIATAVVKHLPFLGIIAVDTKSNRHMPQFLQELCQVVPLKVFAFREQAVVRDAVAKSPFSWEGHHEAKELVEACVQDLLSASIMLGE